MNKGKNVKKKKVSRKVKTFKDLIVWQKSHQLFLDIVEDIESFPNKRVAYIPVPYTPIIIKYPPVNTLIIHTGVTSNTLPNF